MGNQSTKQSGRPKKAVHWKSAEPPSPPGKPVLVPGSPNSTVPDVVTIRWKRPTSDGGSPILGYIVEHRRTGSPHWVRATAHLIQLTELSFSGLEPGWRYQFRVQAQNIVGLSDSSELSDALTVTLQRAIEVPPRFIYELIDTTAIEDEKVEFRVSVAGTPTPDISWFKDGFEMFSSRRTKISTEGDFSVLVIHQAALTDAGEIKCTATNRAGHSMTLCNLSINAYPKIRLPRQYEDGLIIEADEIIRLKVGIAGQPPPVVEWSHNGELLSDGGRYEIETTDKHSSLKIANAQRSDRGEYNLRAYNNLGDDYASFLVTVTARPEPPGKVNISVGFGKAITLNWSAPEDDGGCKIGNYIVEYYRVGWDVWLKANTCRQLSTTLSGLIEGSQYRFRVKAENPYGLSDPSEESETLFIPDPKRGINSATQVPEVNNNDHQFQPLAVPRKRREESRSPARDAEQIKKIKAYTGETSSYNRVEIVREISYGTRDEDFFKPKQSENPRKASTVSSSTQVPSRIEVTYEGSAFRSQQPTPSKTSVSVQHSPNYRETNSLKPKQPEQRNSKSPSPVPQPPPSPLPSVIVTAPAPILPPEPSYPAPARPQSFPSPLKAMERFSKNPSPLTIITATSDNQLAPVSPAPTSPTSSASKQPTIHNSSEFMLVLYNDHEAKDNTRNSTFDFELDDMEPPPPPLSMSAPELNVEPPPAPVMRAAVSSTELLYERAMARFYQAVALEESQNQRKPERRRSYSAAEPILQQQTQSQQQQQQSTSEAAAARLADRRSSLRRRLSGDKDIIVKQSSFEADVRQHSSTVDGVILEEKEDVIQGAVVVALDGPREEHAEIVSISSSMDSMLEELKRRESRRTSRTMITSDDDEMETYHPTQRVISPYTNPDPSQAIEVLTKPLPLPDPNFVPKPILKRPSTELLTKDDKEKKVLSNKQPDRREPSPIKQDRKGLNNLFELKSSSKETLQETKEQVKREKTPEMNKRKEAPTAPVQEKSPEPVVDNQTQSPTVTEIRSALVSEVARQRRLESRQSSIEESRAVADFYGEIVEQVESSKKPRKLPLYMSPDDIRGRSRELSKDRFIRSRSGSRSPLDDSRSVPKSRSPSLTSEQIAIKSKPARESKILRQRSASIEQDSSRPPSAAGQHPKSPTVKPVSAFSPSGTSEEPSRKSRPLRESSAITKKRNVSNTRSRSNSRARDAESIPDGPARRDEALRTPLKTPTTKVPIPQQQPPPPPPPTPSIPTASKTPPHPEPEARSRSQSRTREPTPQEASVKSALGYLTDVALFVLACWLYLFKNPKLAIPVIVLIMYRHISDALRDRIPPWIRRPIS
ncbi:titin [Malaya genurostris]|uniref:titin n=1 Tax=Malaya genurostris TaxID=325434 RepID=UPI0026F3F37D|nr:titin [Malaya genurostris]